jgi:cellulose biosynthesis protein BcsQ
MGVSKILLADKDREYGKALATALSNLHNEFEISIINLETSKNGKPDQSISFQEYDLILLGGYSEEIAESIFRKRKKRTCIVILTEDIVASLTKQSQNEKDHFNYLYKYSNLNDIVSDLNYLAGSIAGKRSLARKSFTPEFIGFFSISGGTGKTAVALGISRELSRHHDKKVLYLNFEEMPATELYIGYHEQSRNLGDFLYYLFEKRNYELCSRLAGFTTADHYGVETFYPTGGKNDMNFLTQQEHIQFLKIISDSCRYDYILLDLKSDLSDDTLFLANQCGKIILMQNDDPVSALKTKKMIAYLDQAGFSGLINRMISAVNRSIGCEYEQDGNKDFLSGSMKKYFIENDGSSFRYASGQMDIDLNHAFGVGIKKITDELLLQTSEGERGQCTENSVQ